MNLNDSVFLCVQAVDLGDCCRSLPTEIILFYSIPFVSVQFLAAILKTSDVQCRAGFPFSLLLVSDKYIQSLLVDEDLGLTLYKLFSPPIWDSVM